MEKPPMFRVFLPLALQLGVILWAQAPQPATPGRLNLIIVEGNGAVNNIKQRTSREAIVQVEDENHKPVAAAAVVFLLPDNGPGGAFAGGAKSVSVTTDASGRAVMPRFQLNQSTGQFDIHVTASAQGRQATTVISQSNVSPTTTPPHHALSAKVIAIIAGAAAAGGVGIWASQHCWSNCTSLTITQGTPVLSPSH